MARIRSIHPGQWTDEDFVVCSPFARLLAIALRNEADDQGVFVWKPITLKMRLFPADNVDVAELLDELADNDQLLRFEVNGKAHGAIRNFRSWQRPEKPNAVHPLPNELRAYVGLPPLDRKSNGSGDGEFGDQSATSRRPVGDPSPKVSAEEGGRRKEVIGRRGEDLKTSPKSKIIISRARVREEPPTDGADAPDDDRCDFSSLTETVIDLAGINRRTTATDLAVIRSWVNDGYTVGQIVETVREVMGRRSSDPPSSLKYFTPELAKRPPKPQAPSPLRLHDGTLIPPDRIYAHFDTILDILEPLRLRDEDRRKLDTCHMTAAEAQALVNERLPARACA